MHAQLANKCDDSHGAVEKVGGGVDDPGKGRGFEYVSV